MTVADRRGRCSQQELMVRHDTEYTEPVKFPDVHTFSSFRRVLLFFLCKSDFKKTKKQNTRHRDQLRGSETSMTLQIFSSFHLSQCGTKHLVTNTFTG